jgi:hypothetical protein
VEKVAVSRFDLGAGDATNSSSVDGGCQQFGFSALLAFETSDLSRANATTYYLKRRVDFTESCS